MKKKTFLFIASLLLVGLFFSCEKEQNLLEEDIVLLETESIDLKCANPEEPDIQKLKHIILVEFIDDMTLDQKDGFSSALLGLKDSIDLIKDIEWGQELSIRSNLSKNYTHCYMLTFLSVDDFFAYLFHPALEGFHEIWLPFVKNVMAFDYFSNNVETMFTNTNKSSWFRHLVLFNYKDEISGEINNQIVEEFTGLPTEIPQIRKMEWGNELMLLELNQDYTDGFLLSFSGFGNYMKYWYHPEHLRFVKNYVEPNVEEVLIFDYIAQKSIKHPPLHPNIYAKDKHKRR